jgi:hypothetical protein
MTRDTPQAGPFFSQRSALSLANYHQQDRTSQHDSANCSPVQVSPRIPTTRGKPMLTARWPRAVRPLAPTHAPQLRRRNPQCAHGTRKRAWTRTCSLCGDSPHRLYRYRENRHVNVSFWIIRHTVPTRGNPSADTCHQSGHTEIIGRTAALACRMALRDEADGPWSSNSRPHRRGDR